MSGGEEAQKYVKDIICNHEIYFAPPEKFNDPFDCRPVISLEASEAVQLEDYKRLQKKYEPHLNREARRMDIREFRKNFNRSPNNPQVTEAIQQKIIDHHTKKIGVLSVTTKKDDILMWSHYADSHQGICLEFDGNFAFMAHAMKVKYTKTRPVINAYRDDHQTQLEKALLTKSDQWEYEDEWRLISYDEGPRVIRFRPQNLTGLIFGAQATASTIEMVRKWVEEREQPIILYKTEVCKSAYKLNIIKY